MRISDWSSDVCSSDLLSVNGAARVADYKGSVGTVWAYNFGGIYSPIPDIKFRVIYSHSVRAPTLGDLYASPSQDFASVDDPCDVNFIDTGTANRPANCAARSEEHTPELQSLMRNTYAGF